MKNPRILLLLPIVFWSFGTLLGRLLSIKAPFLMNEISMIFAFISLLLYCAVIYKKTFWIEVKGFDKRYLFFGLFGFGIYFLSSAMSFRAYNSASETNILNYTWPVFTVLFTNIIFRREKRSVLMHVTEAIAVLLGFFSVVVLATKGNILAFDFSNIPGLIWGLIAGASYGFYGSYSSTVPLKKNPIFLLSGVFSSIVLALPLALSELNLAGSFDFRDLAYAFVCGSIVTVLGEVGWTLANRVAYEQKVNVSSIASLVLVLPVTSTVLIFLVLKEGTLLEPYFALSLVLILLSSVISQKSEDISGWLRRKF